MGRAKGADGRKGEVALRKLIVAGSAVVFAACASPGTPPGGPVDKTAPVLLGLAPDSGRTGVRPAAVIFHFDEVVSERPPSVTSLDQLFVISPRDGTPSVDWKRKDVRVKPKKGWRANTTYVVTMLPGMADLRGNVRNTGAQTFFATGATLDAGKVSGTVWNWLSGTGAAMAYVEAIRLPDSATYIGVADSAGTFTVNYMPPGRFMVRAFIDDNKNRGIDPREAWDSVTVTLPDSSRLALFAIARDSVAPALGTVTADDSVTLRLTFERPLAPNLVPQPGDISLVGADSSRVGVTSVFLPPEDTATITSRPPRPAPPRIVLLRLASPLRPGADYRVNISRVTGIAGASAPAVRTFKAPPAVKPPVLAPSK